MAKGRSLKINRRSSVQGDQRSVEDENNQSGHNLRNTENTFSSSRSDEQHQHCESSQSTQPQNDVRTYDYVVEDPEGKRTRGKTVLANVWNLPAGHRIVVETNKADQPIGDEGGVLGYFCGTIARNGGLCSLSYTRWDYLKKGNKGNNQSMILKEVQERFLYPKVLEKWILKSIGHKWRDYKCYLKGRHYSDDANITDLHNNCPEDVVQDQWISLVNFWRSDEGQVKEQILLAVNLIIMPSCLAKVEERSTKSKLSHKKAKTKSIHTSGTKSHARICEELKKSLQRSPTRTELYLECHQHKQEANITDQIKEIVAQQGNTEMNLDEDPVAQVLGKDRYGRVRGFGLGVKPSDLSQTCGSSYSNKLNMSTNEETTLMYHIRQMKEQIETLTKRTAKQGNIIKGLKRKIRNNESFNSSDMDSCEYSSDDNTSGDDDNDNNE